VSIPRRIEGAIRLLNGRGNIVATGAALYAENQIPSQVNGNRLANDSQTAGGRQQKASLARDEHG